MVRNTTGHILCVFLCWLKHQAWAETVELQWEDALLSHRLASNFHDSVKDEQLLDQCTDTVVHLARKKASLLHKIHAINTGTYYEPWPMDYALGESDTMSDTLHASSHRLEWEGREKGVTANELLES